MLAKGSGRLKTEGKIQRMEYRPHGHAAIAPAFPFREMGGTAAGAEMVPAGHLELQVQELTARLQERELANAAQIREAAQEGYDRGRKEAEQAEGARVKEALERLQGALGSFAAEQDAYFSRVEQEVVQLALAIAGRVLRREAQLDPLLLSGAVRVALGQLSENTSVKLRVPESESAMWEEMMRLLPNVPVRPEVVGDSSLSTGECALETHLGSVDLGVRAQLVEIERGFFDLLEQRPPVIARQPERSEPGRANLHGQ